MSQNKDLERAKAIVNEYNSPPVGAYYTRDALVGMISRALKEVREERDAKFLHGLEDLIKLQKQQGDHPYMQGMTNGLICALSCYTGKEPEYVKALKGGDVFREIEDQIDTEDADKALKDIQENGSVRFEDLKLKGGGQ